MRHTFLLMHLRHFKRQPLRVALAVLAIGAGVTLTVAVLTARSSLDRSFNAYNTAIRGTATLRVNSLYDHGGVDASVLPAIEKVDGVQAAVPLVLTATQVADGHGHDQLVAAIGADCRAEAVFGAFGCDAAAIAQSNDALPPLIGSGLHAAAGPDGVLRTDEGDRSLSDAPVVGDLDRVNRGLVAVYPLPVAQTLFGRPNGLDVVFIVAKPGTSTDALRTALTTAVGPQNQVLDASETGTGASYVSTQLLPFLFLISLFGLATGGQLVYNTMSLSLEERRRELAIESALGGTPRALFAGVLAEAGILGLAGGVLGIGMGLLAARPFVDNLSTYAEQAAGVHLTVHATMLSVVVGLAIGVIASMAAAIVPARRASRLDIAGELVDRSRRSDTSVRIRGRRAIILGSVSAVGLLLSWRASLDGGLESWQPNALVAGGVLAWVCAFQFPAALAPFAVRGIERIPSLQRGPSRVAVSNLLTESRRTSTVLVAIGSAVGMAFVLGGVLPGMADSAETLAHGTAPDRVIVSTLRPNNTAEIDSKLSPDIQAKLAHLPGVARVEHNYWANVDLRGAGMVGIPSTDGQLPHFEVFRGVGADEAFAQDRVMIGAGLARALNLRPGSSFEVPGRFGPVSLVVGGIWAAADELGKSIQLPLETFHRLVGPRPPGSVFLVPQPGVSPAQLADSVRGAQLGDNLKVWDTEQLAAEYARDFRGFLVPFWLLARGLLVVAFIATASTLLLAGIKRRAEHGLLAAVGMPPGDLGRMVLVEAGLFGVLGTACGLIGGLISLEAFSLASSVLTGLNIPFHLDLIPLFVYGGIATVFVLAGAALPAWRTSRLDPVVALRYE